MKILEIVHFFSPLHGGGTTNVLYNQAKHLAKNGHEITIYSSDFECDLDFIESLDLVDVQVFSGFPRTSSVHFTWGMISKLQKDIQKYDVIHVHCYRSFQSIILYFFARIKNVPYIIQAHGGLPIFKEKGRLSLLYDLMFGNRFLKHASKIVALNKKEANTCLSFGLNKDKIVVLPNGIDLKEFDNLPASLTFKKKYGLNADDKVILFLGRLNSIKGIDVLVEAFAGVCQKINKVRLVIVGPDDGYQAKTREIVKALGLNDKVLFTGPLYGTDKLEAYVDADVYVLPSRYETFPMTILEALACNVPVVLSSECGISDVVENGCVGLVVNPSMRNIEMAIMKLVTDEHLQNTFRANCKSTVQRFSNDLVILQLEKTYKQIIKN